MSDEKKDTGWITTIIGLIIAVITGGIALFSAWKTGRENAKLKHEHDLAEEQRRQALVDASVAAHETVKQEALTRAAEHEDRIWELRTQMAATDAQRAEALKKIESITSWDNITIKRENVSTPTASDDTVANPSDQS